MRGCRAISTWAAASALLLQALFGATWLAVARSAARATDCCADACFCFEITRTSCCSAASDREGERDAASTAPVVRSACGCGHHGAPHLAVDRAPLALFCDRAHVDAAWAAPLTHSPTSTPADLLRAPDTPPPRPWLHDRAHAS